MSDWRYLVQSLPDGGWLEWDLPLSGVDVFHELSGPGGLTGTVPVEIGTLLTESGRPLLLPWHCAVWAEASGEIRGGGILVRSEFDGPAWSIECVGLSGYASGQPWTASEYKGVQVDPLSLVRRIWDHLQSQPDGDLGLVVDNTTSPVRVGTASEDVEFQTGSGENVSFEAGPVKFNPWTTSDLGKEIDDLAASTPFDYVTHTAWDGDSSRLKHRLELAYPRRGRRRHDLRFVVGENVTVDPKQSMDGDDYATEVLGLGSGDGRDMVRTIVSDRKGGLRRAVTVADKSKRSKKSLRSFAASELKRRSAQVEVTDIDVADTPLANPYSVVVGDEIFVQSDAGWLELNMWVRVLAISIAPQDSSIVRFTVERSN